MDEDNYTYNISLINNDIDSLRSIKNNFDYRSKSYDIKSSLNEEKINKKLEEIRETYLQISKNINNIEKYLREYIEEVEKIERKFSFKDNIVKIENKNGE